MSALVIGIDPGPIPGLVRLEVAGGRILRRDVVQCTHLIAPDVLKGLLFRFDATVQLVAIERFVVSGRAGTRGSAGRSSASLTCARTATARRSPPPTKTHRPARDAAGHSPTTSRPPTTDPRRPRGSSDFKEQQ